MLVRKDLLMPCAEITHLLVVSTLHVAVQFWPCATRNIAGRLWAVVVQEDKRVAHYLLGLVFDADIVIRACEISLSIVLESFGCIIGEDDIWCLGLEVRVSN